MLYFVRVYEDGKYYEYEYGLIEHALEHLQMEKCYAELFAYMNGEEILIRSAG